jgi:hypothetical protein
MEKYLERSCHGLRYYPCIRLEVLKNVMRYLLIVGIMADIIYTSTEPCLRATWLFHHSFVLIHHLRLVR